MRTPSDSEIQKAAEELGVVQAGEPVHPRHRAKVAKAIQMAKRMQADEAAQVALTGDFAKPIAQIYTDLIQAGLPDTAADRVVAALAPTLWRTTQGAAHARP